MASGDPTAPRGVTSVTLLSRTVPPSCTSQTSPFGAGLWSHSSAQPSCGPARISPCPASLGPHGPSECPRWDGMGQRWVRWVAASGPSLGAGCVGAAMALEASRLSLSAPSSRPGAFSFRGGQGRGDAPGDAAGRGSWTPFGRRRPHSWHSRGDRGICGGGARSAPLEGSPWVGQGPLGSVPVSPGSRRQEEQALGGGHCFPPAPMGSSSGLATGGGGGRGPV